MILFAPLADIMQQQSHKQDLAVDAFLKDARGDRQVFDQIAVLDLTEGRNALDRMFVHGVVMVHVELHHRHDWLKFRHKGRQHAKLVQSPEAALRIAVIQQHIQKYPVGLGIVLNAGV